MRHTNRGLGDLAGGVGIKIGPKRPKLNPDIPLGHHSSLRYRTVGANAIILLLEPFEENLALARQLSETMFAALFSEVKHRHTKSFGDYLERYVGCQK